MKMFRILIADDHEIVRHGLRNLLQGNPEWEICGEAVDGADALDKALKLKPDLAILDVRMPRMNGLEATRKIVEQLSSTKVLILTIEESEHIFRELLKAGASGFVRKSDAARDLKGAIDSIQRGRTYHAWQSGTTDWTGRGTVQTGHPTHNRLTPRELEIVQYVVEGKTSKEISALLGISLKTAETHRSNIMRKLNFHSVSQLVMYAVRNHLVRQPQS
ncbi:MAG: response regulator transcription factor [Acidobacteria bacterium]|nr:response regulator transcription factor [Acidobacteriota bacterium]